LAAISPLFKISWRNLSRLNNPEMCEPTIDLVGLQNAWLPHHQGAAHRTP
jgi:hypothetical protein